VKFLLWALFIVLLIWMMRSKKPATGPSATARATGGVEAMRQCEHCGTYIPESEAVITASGKVFCSEEHRLRHAS
jgi:uncharacterized protein